MDEKKIQEVQELKSLFEDMFNHKTVADDKIGLEKAMAFQEKQKEEIENAIRLINNG